MDSVLIFYCHCNQLSGYKQHKFITLQFCGSQVQRGLNGVCRLCSIWGLEWGGESVLTLFSCCRHPNSLAPGPVFHL